MNFQQLRFVREAVRQRLNLTEAANKLHTSQPGVSKQIKELEDELGVEIFVRRGKRLVALTQPGEEAIRVIERILIETENLKLLGRAFRDQDLGRLVVATTHTQALYALPKAVSAFRRHYPKVDLTLQQAYPTQIAQMVIDREADIAIASGSLDHPELLAMTAYTWEHCVVVPPRHPLLRRRPLTLEALAQYPIVTYDPAFAVRTPIDEAFAAKDLVLKVAVVGIDSDVIKHYVKLGMGVGVVAAMAVDPKHDQQLRKIDAGHLFRSNTTRVAVRRRVLLRDYVFDFIELFAPHLSRKLIEAALAGRGEMYEL